ncbi:hypothetical protein MTO96_021141 [Rhipicephalus appendiculatus]
MERTPAAGKYPKNGVVTFARQDKGDHNCFKRSGVISEFIKEAYMIHNNSVIEVCNRGETDSLILEKRANFLLVPSNAVPMNSYYGYAMHASTSICFLTQRGGPLKPSFTFTWLSFFAVSLILSPLATVSILALRYRARKPPRKRVSISAWTLFLVGLYAGRSSSQPIMSTSTAVRVTIGSWFLGTFLLVQFTQTEITASRSVPAYSSGVRHIAELTSRLGAGALRPCMNFMIVEVLKKYGEGLAHTELVLNAFDRCDSGCTSRDLWYDCLQGAQSGTHAIIHFCRPFREGNDLRSGLIAGEEHLASNYHFAAVHRRYPLRHQHRRIIAMLEASGLVIKAYRGLFKPYQDDATADFDMPFMNYVTIYAIGCSLSLIVFCAEMFIQWRAQRQRHSGYQHRRLMLALEESGLMQTSLKKKASPDGHRSSVPFDMPFTDYIYVYVVGCCLSLLVIVVELLMARKAQRQ